MDPRYTVEALKTKFLQAGKDMCTILEWANTQDVAIKDAGAIRLAQRVFDENNYERDEQGEYQQTRAQPTGAVHNPHEPQAQWSSKSTIKDKTWVGYKTQVAETIQEEPREAGNRLKTSSPPSSHKMRRRATSPVWPWSFRASQHGLGAAPGPVCRWRVCVRAVAPRSSRRRP